MNEYISINDPTFDQKVTLREAYQIMQRFLGWHFHRGMQNTGLLLGDLTLLKDGFSSDPAALYDYLDAVAYVVLSLSGSREGSELEKLDS